MMCRCAQMSDAKESEVPKPTAAAAAAAAAGTIDRYEKARTEAQISTLLLNKEGTVSRIDGMKRLIRSSVLSDNTSFEEAFEALMWIYGRVLADADTKGVAGLLEEKRRLERRVEELKSCLNWDAIERLVQPRLRGCSRSIRGGHQARGRRGAASAASAAAD